jgi:hypothetical protein
LVPQAKEQAREELRVLLQSLVDIAVAEGRVGESKRVGFGSALEERRRKGGPEEGGTQDEEYGTWGALERTQSTQREGASNKRGQEDQEAEEK